MQNGTAAREFDAGLPALWLYSSGSTGGSKCISRNRHQLAVEARAYNKTMGVRAEDVFLCTIPLTHAHGLANALFATLYAAAKMIVLPAFDPGR